MDKSGNQPKAKGLDYRVSAIQNDPSSLHSDRGLVALRNEAIANLTKDQPSVVEVQDPAGRTLQPVEVKDPVDEDSPINVSRGDHAEIKVWLALNLVRRKNLGQSEEEATKVLNNKLDEMLGGRKKLAKPSERATEIQAQFAQKAQVISRVAASQPK